MSTNKFQATFKPNTPGGYEGRHEFWDKKSLTSFMRRAAERIGMLAPHIVSEGPIPRPASVHRRRRGVVS